MVQSTLGLPSIEGIIQKYSASIDIIIVDTVPDIVSFQKVSTSSSHLVQTPHLWLAYKPVSQCCFSFEVTVHSHEHGFNG